MVRGRLLWPPPGLNPFVYIRFSPHSAGEDQEGDEEGEGEDESENEDHCSGQGEAEPSASGPGSLHPVASAPANVRENVYECVVAAVGAHAPELSEAKLKLLPVLWLTWLTNPPLCWSKMAATLFFVGKMQRAGRAGGFPWTPWTG